MAIPPTAAKAGLGASPSGLSLSFKGDSLLVYVIYSCVCVFQSLVYQYFFLGSFVMFMCCFVASVS